MHPLIARLLEEGPVVTDGAWGTQLLAQGLSDRECPDAWNLSRPSCVESIPRSYVEAGSRIVLTNTFRANRLALEPYGLADAADKINRAGAEISRRAAGDRAFVFGSIGPSGRMLFAGAVSPAELQAAFEEQARALVAGGVDGLVIETMSDLAEAKLALAACKSSGLPIVVCMVFDSGREKDRTMTGVTPEQAAAELAADGADVIGANCGSGITAYLTLCRRLRDAGGHPVWVKPNAGTPEIVDDRVVYRTTPQDFASHVPALVQGGASFVGGCCGTSPDFIQAIRKQIVP
jgi:methionine synthase I (cobalamin-dependent)